MNKRKFTVLVEAEVPARVLVDVEVDDILGESDEVIRSAAFEKAAKYVQDNPKVKWQVLPLESTEYAEFEIRSVWVLKARK